MPRDYTKLVFPRFGKNPFRKYDKVVERTLEEIPDMRPPKKTSKSKRKPIVRRNFGPVKRTSTKKRKRTSAKSGRFKKAKKIRKTPTKYSKRHYDDFGSLDRDHALYIGMQTHGSQDRFFDILSEALLKALLAKIRIYPRSYDEQMGITNFDRLMITYTRVSVPGGSTQNVNANSINFDHLSSFEGLGAALKNQMKEYANRDSDGDTVYAYYPTQALFHNDAGDNFNRVLVKDLGECVVEFFATQTITIRNMTPSDGTDGEALDVIGTNPIVGKKYEFKDHRPAVIDSIVAHVDSASEFMSTSNVGINTAVAFPGNTHQDHPLAHPPVPRTVFTNCSKSAVIGIRPGGTKVDKTYFKLKHKLKTLIERMYYNQYGKGTFGGCVFYGFERKVRETGGFSRVKISWDRSLQMSAHVALKTQKSFLRHYQNVPYTGDSGDAP